MLELDVSNFLTSTTFTLLVLSKLSEVGPDLANNLLTLVVLSLPVVVDVVIELGSSFSEGLARSVFFVLHFSKEDYSVKFKSVLSELL